MDWFSRLTGFSERSYEETRSRLTVSGNRLRSLVNDRSYQIGALELVSLQTLRDRVRTGGGLPGRIKVSVVVGNVRKLHHRPEYAGALFQVASQFNLLEMVGPNVTPEHGVARYDGDPTQGPACAIAAGAATIYRNYFAPVGDAIGQTQHRQLDGLADVGAALSSTLGQPLDALWTMSNGYALCTESGLDAITQYLASATPDQLDALRGLLRIGVHSDVEVTDAPVAEIQMPDVAALDAATAASATADRPARPIVSQAFCSALPVAYSRIPRDHWRVFASLVLEAAYEATLLAAVCNTQRGASNIVLLTQLGGGAFGNGYDWINAAIGRALRLAADFALDVRLVSYGPPSPELLQLADGFDRQVQSISR